MVIGCVVMVLLCLGQGVCLMLFVLVGGEVCSVFVVVLVEVVDVFILVGYYWKLQFVSDVQGVCIVVLFVCFDCLVQFDFVDGCLLISQLCNVKVVLYCIEQGCLLFGFMLLIMMVCVQLELDVLDQVVVWWFSGKFVISFDCEGVMLQLKLVIVSGDVLLFIG